MKQKLLKFLSVKRISASSRSTLNPQANETVLLYSKVFYGSSQKNWVCQQIADTSIPRLLILVEEGNGVLTRYNSTILMGNSSEDKEVIQFIDL